jgi:acetylglutamate kinase
VSEWCERLAITPRFADGLRVTDPATLEVATAVLAGLANKRLVARLRAAGIDALGLSALDGGVVEVERHDQAARLGAVGRVCRVNAELLRALVAAGKTPVLASIAALDGELLNVNADDVAAAVAGALGAHTLVLLSDAPGVQLDGGLVPRLGRTELNAALGHADVQGGMIAKLLAARAALEGGVKRVQIAAWNGPGTLKSLLAGNGGTTITGEVE